MSQTTAVRAARHAGRTGPRPGADPGRRQAPRLAVVAPPDRVRSRAGLVVGCLALLGAGLIALLMLNVALEQGAYRLHDLQSRQDQLVDQRQALQERLTALQSPGTLAARATSLGMVPAPNVVFLHGSDGTVLGVPEAAKAPVSPTVTKSPKSPKGATPTATPTTPAAKQPAAKQPPAKGTTAAKTKTTTKTTTTTTTGRKKPVAGKPAPTHRAGG